MLAGHNRSTLWLLVSLAVIAVLYLSTLAVNHSEIEDSLWHAKAIMERPFRDQFHPNHLLYGFLNHAFFMAWQIVGYEGNAVVPMQIINVVAGLFSLSIFYLLAIRLGILFPLAHFCLLSVALSYGFWWQSVEIDTYALPTIFVLLCIHRLLLINEDFSRSLNHLLLGMFNAIAILFHQQHVIFCAIVIFGYLWILHTRRREITWGGFLHGFSLYAAVGAFLVLTSYAVVIFLVEDLLSYEEIRSRILGHAATGNWGFWTFSSPLKALVGFPRAFVGVHFLFSFPGVPDMLGRLFPDKLLREELFLVEDFSIARNFLLLILSLATLSLFAFLVFSAIKGGNLRKIVRSEYFPAQSSRRGLAFVLLGAYLLAYALFNTWWEPLSSRHWVSLIPMVFLILGLLLNSVFDRKGLRVSFGLFLVCLFLANLFGSVVPQLDRDHDYWYAYNAWLIKNGRPGDLVVTGSGYLSEGYLMTYSRAGVVGTQRVRDPVEQVRGAIARYEPKRVLVSSSVFSPLKELSPKITMTRESFVEPGRMLIPIHTDSHQEIFLYK